MVNPDVLVSASEPANHTESIFSAENPYPNPFSEALGFSFKLQRRALVSLSLLDLQGKVCARLIDHEWRGMGKYLEKIEADRMGILPGTYFILLEVDGKIERRKVVLID